jgi:hypothetical protein
MIKARMVFPILRTPDSQRTLFCSHNDSMTASHAHLRIIPIYYNWTSKCQVTTVDPKYGFAGDNDSKPP